MKTKFISTLSAVAVALAISTSASFATVYTKATYQKALAAKIGKKTGAAAYGAAAQFLKLTLTDKRNAQQVASFTQVTTAALRKPVAATLQVAAASKLADAVINGYFTKINYNPKDPNFVKALTLVGRSVTSAKLKTPASANKIFAPLNAFNTKKKGSADLAAFLKGTVNKSLGLPVS